MQVSMIKVHIQRMSVKKNTMNKFPGNGSGKEQEGEKKNSNKISKISSALLLRQRVKRKDNWKFAGMDMFNILITVII